LDCIDYHCRTESTVELDQIFRLLDEFVIFDFNIDLLSKNNIILVCCKAIDSVKLKRECWHYAIHILYKFAENK